MQSAPASELVAVGKKKVRAQFAKLRGKCTLPMATPVQVKQAERLIYGGDYSHIALHYQGEKLGLGAFAAKAIPAGQVVAMYSGLFGNERSALSTGNYALSYVTAGFPSDCQFWTVNAESFGGIARFFQCLPLGPESADQFEALLNTTLNDQAFMADWLKRYSADNKPIAKSEVINFIRFLELSGVNVIADLRRELSHAHPELLMRHLNDAELESLKLTTSKKLATANLAVVAAEIDGVFIMLLVAARMIRQGEIMGFSYGSSFFHNELPSYFTSKGELLAEGKECQQSIGRWRYFTLRQHPEFKAIVGDRKIKCSRKGGAQFSADEVYYVGFKQQKQAKALQEIAEQVQVDTVLRKGTSGEFFVFFPIRKVSAEKVITSCPLTVVGRIGGGGGGGGGGSVDHSADDAAPTPDGEDTIEFKTRGAGTR